MSDNIKWITLAEVQLTQELMRQEENEMIRNHWHNNYLYRQKLWKENINYPPYTEEGITYRTPKYEEFIVGFKFESNYWYFSKNYDKDWVEAEITEDNIQDVKELWRNDAYPTEFRVKVINNLKEKDETKDKD